MSHSGVARASGYVESDGERIYYETTGHGSPIVLCHGLGGNHAIWWRQIEPLAAERTVVTWDQRGFGNSTAALGDVTLGAARRDLARILDHLGYDSVDLLGQSMGGWVALGYTIDNPARVRSLLLSTTLAGAERKYVDALVTAEPDHDRFNRREHPVLSKEFCRQHPDLGVLYNQISSFGAKPPPDVMLRGMAEERFDPDALRALSLPVLVVMAEEDEHCPVHAMEPVVDGLAHGRLTTVPGGHSAYFEHPDEWNGTVLEFLDDVENALGGLGAPGSLDHPSRIAQDRLVDHPARLVDAHPVAPPQHIQERDRPLELTLCRREHLVDGGDVGRVDHLT